VRERVGWRTGGAYAESSERKGQTVYRWSAGRVESEKGRRYTGRAHAESSERVESYFDNSQHNNLRFVVLFVREGFLVKSAVSAA
jgi:hypothetical protein